MSSLILPSYKSGFATGDLSEAPGLWKGVRGIWSPSLGPTGLILRDQSAFQNHGVLTSMDPATAWVTTEEGWGIQGAGNGTDDHILLDQPWSFSGTLTLSALIRFTNTASDNEHIFTADDQGANRAYQWRRTSAGKVEFIGFDPGVVSITGDAVLLAGIWYHLAAVYDGSVLQLYLNGQPDGGTANARPDNVPSAWSMLAGRPASPTAEAAATLAVVRKHDRALSPGEIQQLHAEPNAMLTRRPTAIAVGFEEAVETTSGVFSISHEVSQPSYKQGFAVGDQSMAPGLWKGLVFLGSPSLGPTGLTLRDQSAFQNHGTLTNMDPATDWVTTEKGWALDFLQSSNQFISLGKQIPGVAAKGTVIAFLSAHTVSNAGIIGGSSTNSNACRLRADRGEQRQQFSDGSEAIVDWGAAADTEGWRMWSFRWDGSAVTFGRDLETLTDDPGGAGTMDWSLIDQIARRGTVGGYNGLFGTLHVYDRILLDSEIQQLNDRPNAMLTRRPTQVAVSGAVPAVGGVVRKLVGAGGLVGSGGLIGPGGLVA